MEKSNSSVSSKTEKAVHQVEYVNLQEFGYEKSGNVKGDPVAKIRLGYHPHDLKVGEFLAEKAEKVLEQMGAKNVKSSVSGAPPPNLQAGGCRFGNDPDASVLDKNCKAHEVENLYVTDGSFMPTGGSVTYTWTIYANAFRVAEKIKEHVSRI